MESSPLMLKLAGLSAKKAMIFGLVVLGVFYALVYDDGNSLETQIQQTQTQLDEERKKYEETQKLMADQDSLREQIKTLGENLKIVLSQLPTEINSFRLVRDIQKIARAAGAEIVSIKPEKSETTQFYEEIPVEVALRGSYKDLVTFLYYVSGLERITRIRDFELTHQEAGTSSSGTDVLEAEPKLALKAQVVSFKYIPMAPKAENPENEGQMTDDEEVQ